MSEINCFLFKDIFCDSKKIFLYYYFREFTMKGKSSGKFKLFILMSGILCILSNHRVLEQEGGFTNYTKRSDTVRVAGATPLTTPHVWTNHRIRVFWKNQIFWFWGVPKNFFDPKKPYLALKLHFWEVILLKLFDLSYGFGATDGRIALFWHNQPWKSPKP